jgi:DNA-directed RNA polymerase specialized sigma24 family protein
VERVRARLHVELAHQARERLRSIAVLGTNRRTALTLRAAGYSYREIEQLLGITNTWVNRHVTEGRQALGAPRPLEPWIDRTWKPDDLEPLDAA